MALGNKAYTRKRKRKKNPLVVLLLGIALMLAGTWSYQLLQMNQAMEQRKAELLQQKADYIAENAELREEIERLNTPSYIEQLARDKLGLVRKGEILIAPKESDQDP
jgi:cell division protein DivIC